MAWFFDAGSPIYLQIIEHIKLKIAVGEYKSGTRLSSVRELAAEAEVNPNTMQKSLAELEREGLLYVQRTSGRYITENKELIDNLKSTLAGEHIDWYFNKMSMLGYSKKEAAKLLLERAERDDLI